MKRLAILAVLVVALFSFSGCGFFRGYASVESVNKLLVSDGYNVISLYYLYHIFEESEISDVTLGSECVIGEGTWICFAEKNGETYIVTIKNGFHPSILHVKKIEAKK